MARAVTAHAGSAIARPTVLGDEPSADRDGAWRYFGHGADGHNVTLGNGEDDGEVPSTRGAASRDIGSVADWATLSAQTGPGPAGTAPAGETVCRPRLDPPRRHGSNFIHVAVPTRPSTTAAMSSSAL
jgi:hypothetical protein